MADLTLKVELDKIDVDDIVHINFNGLQKILSYENIQAFVGEGGHTPGVKQGNYYIDIFSTSHNKAIRLIGDKDRISYAGMK